MVVLRPTGVRHKEKTTSFLFKFFSKLIGGGGMLCSLGTLREMTWGTPKKHLHMNDYDWIKYDMGLICHIKGYQQHK